MTGGTANAGKTPSVRPDLRFYMVSFGQNAKVTLPFNINFFMSLSKLAFVAAWVVCGAAFLAAPMAGIGQTNYYSANGSEYAPVGLLPGDQVYRTWRSIPRVVLWCGRIMRRTAVAGG